MNPIYACQDYEELSSPDDDKIKEMVAGAPSETLLQLKYDGIWAKVVIDENCGRVFSKTGQLKATIPIDPTLPGFPTSTTVLLGEYMYGSQWSQHPSRKGLLYIFDCPFLDGIDISGQPYETRYRKALSCCSTLGKPFQPVPCYSILNLGGIWLEIEKRQSHEGVILRRWDSPFNTQLYKLKREVEDDFIILDMVEGKGKHEGRMGALKLGQFNPATGQVEYVCDVGGGFDDLTRRSFWDGKKQIVGQVCLVKGKGRFESGAIRHPNFVRLRCDKLPNQCILKRTSE